MKGGGRGDPQPKPWKNLLRSGAKYPSFSCLRTKENKKNSNHAHTHTSSRFRARVLRAWMGTAESGWGRSSSTNVGREKNKRKKRQSILNHNVHSSLMRCTPGYRVAGAEREGTGPSPAIGTHKTTEARDVKELQEEEKPNFSGKSLQKKSLHQHTLPPPHRRENRTKQKK